MNLKRALISTAAVAALITGGTVTTASAIISHDLQVTNVGSRGLRVCKHWSNWDSTATYNRDDCYSKGSCLLRKDERSHVDCGYRDTDGARVDAGYSLMHSKWGPDGTVRGCRSRTFWVKLSPSLIPGSNKVKLYLKKCRAYA